MNLLRLSLFWVYKVDITCIAKGGKGMWKLILAILILIALAVLAVLIYFKQK